MVSCPEKINKMRAWDFIRHGMSTLILCIALNGGCLLESENNVYNDGKQPPRIYFYNHWLKQETSNYAIGDSAFIKVLYIQKKGISEEGGKVQAKLKTQLGDIENITLFWIGSYLYAGFGSRGFLINSSILAKSYNGIIEAKSNGDTLQVEYLSIEGKFRKAKTAVHP